MPIYCLYIFDRHCECIYYQQWSKGQGISQVTPSPLSTSFVSSTDTQSRSTKSNVDLRRTSSIYGGGDHSTGSSTVLPTISDTTTMERTGTTDMWSGAGTLTGTGNVLHQSEQAKLVYGVVYSLRNVVRKLTGNHDDTFISYRTSVYKLHYYETLTGLKFVLMTDPNADNLKLALKQIYMTLYVEYVIKNPLSPIEHPGGEGVGNIHFKSAVDRFIRGLAAAK